MSPINAIVKPYEPSKAALYLLCAYYIPPLGNAESVIRLLTQINKHKDNISIEYFRN